MGEPPSFEDCLHLHTPPHIACLDPAWHRHDHPDHNSSFEGMQVLKVGNELTQRAPWFRFQPSDRCCSSWHFVRFICYVHCSTFLRTHGSNFLKLPFYSSLLLSLLQLLQPQYNHSLVKEEREEKVAREERPPPAKRHLNQEVPRPVFNSPWVASTGF